MKRRQFLKAAGAGLAASVAAPAVAESLPEVQWRCTSSFPKSLDTIHGTAETFAKAVAAATDDKFQIKVFADGELLPGLQAADAVTNGTVEMAYTASYYYVGKDPTFALATAVPFGLNSRMQNAWMFFGGGMQLMNDFYKGYNIYAIPCGNSGCQMGGWFRNEIKTADDLKGLKMRIGGYAGRVLQKLGCVPQPVAERDLYASLQKGTIDAAEWVGPYDDEKLRLYEVAPYYYYPAWWEGGVMLHNFINLGAWNALPPAYRAVVSNCSQMANTWMQARYDALNPAALKRLVVAGAKLRPFPPQVLDACLDAALEVGREIAAANETFKKINESLAAFRHDEYLWWRVAEYTYDTDLIRNHART